jgi:hypothetical protein
MAIPQANSIVQVVTPTGTWIDVDIIPGASIDVRIQDQTTPQFALFLGESLDLNVTFRSTQTANLETLNITSATVPIIGNFICAKENAFFTQVEILGVTVIGGGDYDIDIAIPLDHEYTVGATIVLQNVDMNVDSSLDINHKDFYVTPEGMSAGTEWDITRMIVSMTHGSAGDDGKFGGIPALALGVYFRIEDGTNYNLFNAKDNSQFALQGYDITYPIRSGGGGAFGTRSRITFNGSDKRGVVFRLAADTGDRFMGHTRDDLSGLDSFRVMIQGQVVDP